MLIVTLHWQEPQEGSHVIVFPDGTMEDLAEIAEFVDLHHGDAVGETIAKMECHPQKGEVPPSEEDPWEDLALNLRYSSGEELYEEDCEVFTKHGVERC
jgi:hypothetical protein